jgi:hypothetical protein
MRCCNNTTIILFICPDPLREKLISITSIVSLPATFFWMTCLAKFFYVRQGVVTMVTVLMIDVRLDASTVLLYPSPVYVTAPAQVPVLVATAACTERCYTCRVWACSVARLVACAAYRTIACARVCLWSIAVIVDACHNVYSHVCLSILIVRSHGTNVNQKKAPVWPGANRAYRTRAKKPCRRDLVSCWTYLPGANRWACPYCYGSWPAY